MGKAKEIIVPRNEFETKLFNIQRQSDRIGQEIFEGSLRQLKSFDTVFSLRPAQALEFSSLTKKARETLGFPLEKEHHNDPKEYEVRYFYDNKPLDQQTGDEWKLQLPIWYFNYFSEVEGYTDSLEPFLVRDLGGNIGWRICLRFYATRIDTLAPKTPRTISIAIPLEAILQPPVPEDEYDSVCVNDDDDKIYQTHKNSKFPY